MSVQSIKLQNTTTQGRVAAAGFTPTAAVLLIIPPQAKAWAKFVCRHQGNQGIWYGSYEGRTPSPSSHDFVVGPGEPHQDDNPPVGVVNMLAHTDSFGNLPNSFLDFSAGWFQ